MNAQSESERQASALAVESTSVIVKAEGLTKQVATPDHTLVILRDVNLEVPAGEAVAIHRASGSGKST